MTRTSADSADLRALTQAWGEPLSKSDQAMFLGLAPAKRKTAIARVEVLRKLTEPGPKPRRTEMQFAAAHLGIGVARLRGLMREWRQSPTLSIVTPHGARRPRERPGLPSHQIATRIIEKALAQSPDIAEPSIGRRIAAICERLGLDPPARMTVRSLLDEARRRIPPHALLHLIDTDPLYTQGPGDRLVLVDQYFKAIIADAPASRRPAQARLLIDVATGFIVAAGETLTRLAEDAEKTLTRDGYALGPWRLPRTLLLRTDLSENEKAKLRSRAQDLGVALEDAKPQQTRRWTQSLLRSGFQHLEPGPPPTRRSGARDDWPTLTPQEFKLALQLAVSEHRGSIDRTETARKAVQAAGNADLSVVLARLFGRK